MEPGFDMLYEIPGQDVWPRIKLSWPTYSMSRPLIERTLRRQVERIGNITVQRGCRVLSIVSEAHVLAATGQYLSELAQSFSLNDLCYCSGRNSWLEPMCGGRSPLQIRDGRRLRFVLPKVASGECPSCLVRSGAWPQLNRTGPDTEPVSVHQANWRHARSWSRSNGQAGR